MALLTWNLCNVVLNIIEIEYFFTVLDFTEVEYLQILNLKVLFWA